MTDKLDRQRRDRKPRKSIKTIQEGYMILERDSPARHPSRLDQVAEIIAEALMEQRAEEIEKSERTTPRPRQPRFTPKQGQYLAFIYYYTKVNGKAPAEADLERYFQVSPPSIHDMVLRLEKLGLIERTPGKGRSIKLLVPRSELPDLE